MKFIKNTSAISEIIGTTLLLMIAVSMMSVIFLLVITNLEPSEDVLVNVAGKIDNDVITLEHKGGESLGPDTTIELNIAEYDRVIFTVNDGFLSNSFDDIWDIGEILEYYDPNIIAIEDEGPKINVLVSDIDSNSLVLIGTLQDGYTIPRQRGKGGIWHFDECYPSPFAFDSSGNDNTGILGRIRGGLFFPGLFTGPNWINEEEEAYLNCSLSFDGIDDVVYVNDSWSLDINQNISIEARLKTVEEQPGVMNIDFDESFAFNPKIIHVSNETFAIVGEGQLKQEGIVHVINITSDGTIIKNITNNKLSFDPNWGQVPDIVKISENNDYNIFAIAYWGKIGGSDHGYIKTIRISPNNGSVFDTSFSKWEFGLGGYDPEIIHIIDDTYAVIYRGIDDGGYIKTVQIHSDGSITDTGFSNWQFDLDGYEPEIIHLSNDTYSIVYRDELHNGYIQNINISSDGIISETSTERRIIDTPCLNPIIIRISGSIYGIIYQGGDGDDGYIRTYDITENSISNQNIYNNSRMIVLDDFYTPDITSIRNDTFAIVYSTELDTGSSLGKLITIQILSNGTIDGDVTNLLESINTDGNNPKCFKPKILHVYDQVYAICYYADTPHRGFVSTARLGEDPTPPRNRGIFKRDSYGLYSRRYDDIIEVFGTINGFTVSGIINNVLEDDWNHVKMIYDYSNQQIELYFNGILLSQEIYNAEINMNQNPLLFGHRYNGYIDDVIISDNILAS